MKREFRTLLLLLFGFLILNGLTLSRYPSVWVDEVQFADPAVSLASGQGFTSTAWFAQDSSQFWAGNVPLYPALLSGWLKLFGPNLIAERSMNLVLFCVVILLLWRWMRTSGAVKSPAWRLTAVALLLCGHAMVFSYRSGRYDVTGMLLAAIILNTWSRPLWLIVLGALLPAAGLQLIPASLVLCALAAVIVGRKAIRGALSLLTGVASGGGLLYGFYRTEGVWDSFRASTSAIGVASQTLAQKLAGLPGVYFADKSRVLLAIVLLLAFAWNRNGAWRASLALPTFAIATLFVLPAALQLAGKCPIYYGWMVFIPLVIASANACQDMASGKKFCAALLVAAAFLGLPLRVACAAAGWSERNPSRLSAFVRSSVPAGSDVLADFKAYYALRACGIRPLLPTYVPALPASERSAVNVIIVRPDDAPKTEAELGGEWQATGAILPAPATPRLLKSLVAEMREESYPLAVYRRVPGPSLTRK